MQFASKMSSSASEGTTKAMVADQISQAVLSTSNLLHLMQESSPAQGLIKLPKNLLGKTPNVKNTSQILEQMPRVISTLDAHLENALQCASQLDTVRQVLMSRESTHHLSLPGVEEDVIQTSNLIKE